MRQRSSYREAFSDNDLLGHVMQGPTWKPHHVLNMGALGETLTDEERVKRILELQAKARGATEESMDD